MEHLRYLIVETDTGYVARQGIHKLKTADKLVKVFTRQYRCDYHIEAVKIHSH